MPPEKRLTPREIEVLRYVLAHQPVSVGEAAAHFAETAGRARTTVLTVMERLRRTGWLRRRRSGGVYRYIATVTEAELQQQVVGRFVEEMLGGSVAPVAAWLGGHARISPAELAELQEAVRRLERRGGAAEEDS